MIEHLTVRPIRFTHDIPAWRRLLETLGAHLVLERPGWLVYAAGSGRVALHQASEEQPPGSTLAFETSTPLSVAVPAAAEAGVPITLGETDHGLAGTVTALDGTSFTLDTPTPVERAGAASEPRLSVLPIWYGQDTSMIRSVIEGLGAGPRLVGRDEGWIDHVCQGGGLVAAHRAEEPGVELAFEWDGDVDVALRLLEAAGIEAMLIDETYSRTVQITDPDNIKEIWINEKQTDHYGYTRATPAP